jgi:hypothetical protein
MIYEDIAVCVSSVTGHWRSGGRSLNGLSGGDRIVEESVEVPTFISPNSLLPMQLELEARVGIESSHPHYAVKIPYFTG